ncbi:glycosyltransferase family 39 protein [Ruminococcus sp.]|uniref:glycosyltransferase family 39 protein n=1 Tax=Ruminococcus sp. TaxID=41978 RepID=UPI00388CFBFB
MENTLNARNKFVQFCSCLAIYLIAVLFALLSVGSILQTCRIDQANPYAELVNFDNDFFLGNLALIGLSILGALFLLRKNISIGKVSTRFIVIVMLLVSTIISLAWITLVRSIASGDAMILLNTARDAAKNTYQSFHTSYDYYGNYSYYLFFPYQLGYVFFAEILYRIFGTASSDILFQIPNVIALDFIYVGMVMIAKRLFQRRSVTNLTAILLTLCFQPMFMTTFTYGILLGLAFSVWSVYHVIRFIQDGKIVNAILAVVLMSVSVLLKYNNMIVMAAVCIALVLHIIDKKKLIAIAVVAAMILCPIGLQKAVIASYAARSGAELNKEVSQTMFAYMGICDSGMAPGWWNAKAMEVLRDNHMDVEKANQISSQGISDRMRELTTSGQFFEFYKKKFLSQFNEPAYESIWLSQVRKHNYPEGEKLPAVVDSVYTGGLHKVLDIWFNYFTMMIFISFTAAMIWLIFKKKLNTAMLILPVTILGAFFYHMMFEAKSQYILPYFILMIPFAAYGFIESIRALHKKSDFLYQ